MDFFEPIKIQPTNYSHYLLNSILISTPPPEIISDSVPNLTLIYVCNQFFTDKGEIYKVIRLSNPWRTKVLAIYKPFRQDTKIWSMVSYVS